MMRGILAPRFLFLCAGALAVAAPAAAQTGYTYGYQQPETPSAALARHVRTLASDPRDFGALIGAGKAALELGDPQAAAGFFARADEVNPRSPLPQAGMGAVSVANGEPNAAMPYFSRALQLGAPLSTVACDRGLAYDLLGQQPKAQADYRAALGGPDATEARRRLALSLAISGDRANALAALAPLAAKGDSTTNRVRAFVLALTGDPNGAMTAIDAAMPGSWSRVAPFLQRLSALPAGEKAAAVNLGIFPDSNQPAYAYNSAPAATPSTIGVASSVSTDRLSGLDSILQPAAPPAAQPGPVQVAYAAPPKPATVQRTPAVQEQKVWLQLASGSNADALSGQFHRIKSRNRDLFKGIDGYVEEDADRARLLIGPFRGSSDADIFAEDLQSVGVDAFKWTNSASDRIVPLASE
jgi:Flp pilus assembly protein TadD